MPRARLLAALSVCRTAARRTLAVAIAAAVVAALLVSASIEAHKPVTSKYTYNEDIFPIFRTYCSACHVDGGIAPMSLVTYNDAYPWAESIKEEVINQRMPPWHADDAFGAFRHSQSLTAKEIDLVMDWAWGGTPEGSPANRPEPVTLVNDWVLGAPDRILEMEGDGGLPANESEGTRVVTLATGFEEDRWVEAVDLLPGNPAIVRDATIALVRGEARFPLAVWVPGHPPVSHEGVAFRLPAGAVLELAIHYRKTWTYEGLEAKDRSAVGVYFSVAEQPMELRRIPVEPAPGAAPDADSSAVTFDLTAEADLDVLAVYPEIRSNVKEVRVEAVRPDGSREPMLRVDDVPSEWQRRYWFDQPFPLPKGSRVEVIATFDPDAASPDPGVPGPRVWIDVVSRASTDPAP